MAKLFFDVFPTLDVSGDMKKILSEMEVTKVGMNHERDHIRVYLLGSHLIHKNNITQLERSIEEQIFKGKRMNVRIIEKYQLSEQYTARTLMDMYKDSILEELKAYSLMEYNLLRASKMEFTDDSHLHLVLENTIIAQTRSHEIVEFLEKIVCERCGMNLIVDLDFEEPKESRYKKNSDLQIQFEIKNILKNINLKDEDGEPCTGKKSGRPEASRIASGAPLCFFSMMRPMRVTGVSAEIEACSIKPRLSAGAVKTSS